MPGTVLAYVIAQNISVNQQGGADELTLQASEQTEAGRDRMIHLANIFIEMFEARKSASPEVSVSEEAV